MFCIKCGKDARIGNFCKECFVNSEDLFEIENFRTVYCAVCGIKDEDLAEEIENKIKTSNILNKKSVLLKKIGSKVFATVSCSGVIKGAKKDETRKILVILKKKMCDKHVKLSGGYYEAVIQARGDRKDEIIKKVLRLVPKDAITDILTLNEGYNIKLMRKQSAIIAAGGLRKKYSIKESYKLVGSKKGAKLYRNYYAVR